MVDLKRKDTIDELKNRFVHTVKMVYPKENVKNMTSSWTKAIEEADQWLGQYDAILKEQVEKGIASMEATLEKAGDELKQFESMSEEEQVNKLKEEFAAQKIRHAQAIESLKETKDNYVKEVTAQMQQIKSSVLQKRQDKEEALKLWSKAQKKF